MINIINKIFNIIKNVINCFIKSNYIFPLFILLIILYTILNYIFEIIEKEFTSSNNGIESIVITIPNTYIFKNTIIIMLIILSNFIYNIFIVKN